MEAMDMEAARRWPMFAAPADLGPQAWGSRVFVHDRQRIEAFAGPRLCNDENKWGPAVDAF